MTDTPVIRSGELRARNRHRLLKTLRRHGICSRNDLGKLTGLSQASISMLSTQLIDEGVVQVDKPKSDAAKARGRPQNALMLAPDACSVVTTSLSIDRLTVCLSDYAGQCLAAHKHTLDTRAMTGQELIDAFISTIDVMITEMQASPSTISVAFQGVTENQTGEFLWSPIIKARHVPVGSRLQSHFGIPVSVQHDCRLIADALHDQHHDTLGNSFAAVLFSHGVGMGLYLGGSAFSGTRSSGLELGHLLYRSDGALCRCGRHGCIEAYAADYAIARSVQGESAASHPVGRVPKTQMSDIIRSAEANDAAACKAFASAGEAVGYGLASLFTLFDPMPVALIGRSDAAFSLMKTGLENGIQLAGPESPGVEHDIQFFNDYEPLLQHGLVLDALNSVDRKLAAHRHSETVA